MSLRQARLPLAPSMFGMLAICAALLTVAPILNAHGWNASFFVVAGDLFVDRSALASKIVVRTASAGYDGQFFYRMAVAPFSFEPVANGIHFDVPVYRSQRFLYPLLAWIASFGRPAGAATALFLINLAGIGAIAGIALALVRRLGLPDLTALCMALWPGLLATLTHDTSEIAAAAFMLAALLCRSRGAWAAYVLFGVAATFSRETTAPAFAGLAAWDAVSAWRGGARRPVVCSALVLLPIVAWHETLPSLWHVTASEGVLAHNFGLPVIGLIRTLGEHGADLMHVMPAGPNRVLALTSFAAMVALYAFLLLALFRWPSVIRRGGEVGGMAAALLPVALLLLFLREGDGPFATPTEFCRAFTEFWMLGCVVIAAAGPKRPPVVLALAMAGTVLIFEWASFGVRFI